MANVKLTKNEMRNQQIHLAQLEKYLPTLQLKKAMLQAEVQEMRQEISRLEESLKEKTAYVKTFSGLLATRTTIDPLQAVQVKQVSKRYENIAGVEVPRFENIEFEAFSYHLFETEPWVDAAVVELRHLAELGERIQVANEQKQALEKELKEVSTRVNLFEKILIPRAIENIRSIRVFLGDQQLASVSRAKVAKTKIEANKLLAKLARQAKEKVHASRC